MKPALGNMLLLGAMIAVSSCTAETTGADLKPVIGFDNSPLHLPSGLNNGPGTLTSDLGIEYQIDVTSHRIEPPVLWDGTWTATDADGDSITFHVGAEPSSSTQRNASELAACWQQDPDPVSPRSVRCAQAILLRAASEQGYQTAETLLRDALAMTPEARGTWERYCHLGGTIVAAGAVIGGQDARTIMREHPSLCDYAVSHGVGAAVATLNPDDPVTALTATCDPDPASEILAYSYGSQCWHGGGMGLGRLHRFDYGQALQACQQAPDPGWAGNCIEGIFVSYRDYSARMDADDPWTERRPTLQGCNDTVAPASDDLYYLSACYRYSAYRIYKNLNVAELAAEKLPDVLQQANSVMGLACALAPDATYQEACWTAGANLLADIAANDIENRAQIARWAEICENAPEDGISCYQRYFSTLVRNPQRRTGVPLEELLTMAPANLRPRLETIMAEWLRTVEDRGEG